MRGTFYLLFFHQVPLKCWYLQNRQHDATSLKIATSRDVMDFYKLLIYHGAGTHMLSVCYGISVVMPSI